MSEPKVFYSLGQRDVLAGLFALIRSQGEEAALKEVAGQYRKAYGTENPHVEWYLNQKPESTIPVL